MASTQNDMEDWVKTIRRVIWAPFGGGELTHKIMSVSFVSGIFGQKLEETVRYERRYGNKLAPMLVEQCVDFIRQWGLQEEGLFRLPGQANLVKELQDAFDCGEKPSFNSSTDVHTVASLLKLYLRELPEPVMPFCKYDEFLACTKLLSKDQDSVSVHTTCTFLDEVQSYSGVNKMSVQNLATVFGPNILRPKVEDPVAIMEGAVLVQQLMAVLIGQHSVIFPLDEDSSPGTVELCNNNNPSKRPTAGQLQNKENNNTTTVRHCTWETPDSPTRATLDNGSPRSGSPRNGPTNQALTSTGTLQARRTKMGVQNGGVRMGVSSTDVVNGTVIGRSNGLWSPPGCVTLREGKGRDGCEQQNRLSTYDNVQVQQMTSGQPCLSSSSCEDKQSVDSATWSTSSCEISLPENSASCRSSTTTCPEQDFYTGAFEDPLLDGAGQEERRDTNGGVGGGRSSRGTSSSENSEAAFPLSNGANSHSALHSLVGSLKQEMMKQKSEYEHRNVELEAEMVTLRDELEQERKKFTMVEIKLRNAERAKDDAEKRNEMLQKEMEQFFSTFGDLTTDPRRPDRANTIWIQ
uniref:Rho GTPase activating protein 24 n=1 Tax=Astyanax mexicanus TaxID=7994 RepID=A0A8B9GVT4_ASTMX